jgi:hypothetical protein
MNRELGTAQRRITETQHQREIPRWFSDQTFNFHEELNFKALNLKEIFYQVMA